MPTNKKKKKRLRLETIFLALLLLGAGYGLYQFSSWSSEKDLATVVFQKDDGSQTQAFKLHVAANRAARDKGLMFRKEGFLKEHHGMLFVFPADADQSFWMKNTYLSLDMVFLHADGTVVGILENVPPLNEQPRKIGKASRYVVEFLAGTSAKHGIVPGVKAVFESPLPRASS